MANRPEKEKRKSDRVQLSKAEKIAIPIILIIAVWVVYSVVTPSPPGSQPSVTNTGSPSGLAPDFTLPMVGGNGQPITLSSFRGKVVFLEFMEPWCPHCQHMAPVLEDMYTRYYQHNANVTFISVAGPWNGPDGNPASASDAAKFIGTYGSTWTYVYDSSGNVVTEYGVTATPTIFIISKSGAVVTSFQGEEPEDTLTAAINSAINAS